MLETEPMTGIEPGPGRQGDADAATWPALMRRAQDGDQAAYRRLLVAITPYLRAMASRFLQSPNDTEDALQDILLTVHTIRRTYDPERPFKPWLAGIARHRLVDRFHGKRRIAAREVAWTLEHETFADPAPNREAGALDGPALQAALRELPAGQRQAIELLKLQEMSLKEAATVSGMSVAALKVATHRGLKTLRRIFSGGASV